MNSGHNGTLEDRLLGLDVLRAFAVLLTFAMHFSWLYAAYFLDVDLERVDLRSANSVERAWLYVQYYSLYGVYLFFMISGLLIARKWLSADSSVPRAPSLAIYLRYRALRIFPPFWIVLAATWLYSTLSQSAALPQTGPDVVANALLLNWFAPEASPPWLIVSWSLQVEWLFYLSMPLVALILQRAPGSRRLLLLWFIAVVVAVFLKGWGGRHFAYPLYFAVGASAVLRPDLAKRCANALSLRALLALLLAIHIAYAWGAPIGAEKLPWKLGAFDVFALAFLFVGGALFFRVAYFPPQWVVNRHLVILGRISYSFYLWHLLVLTALFVLNSKTGVGDALAQWVWWIRWSVLAIAGLGVSVVISWVSFRLFESPYFKRRSQHAS